LGHPQSGISISGDRLDIGVNDVIAAEGRRTPDSTVAQRHYRFGFILVVAQGALDSLLTDSIQQVETYRQQFPAFFAKAATGNAAAETTLNRSLKLSLLPAAGVIVGAAATATLTVQTAPKADLTLQLQASGVYAQVPATVKIPAGSTSVSFTLTGVRSGVEELLAMPADPAYETAFARVQVANASFAQLVLVSGGIPGPVPTVVRLTDVNGLPYPGARLTASAEGGSVSPAASVTDAQGQAAFNWTAPGSLLKITVDSTSIAIVFGAGNTPSVSAVVNAASSEIGISPGALQTLYGARLAGGRIEQAGYPWPTTLGGVQVLVGGTPLPLLYASDDQINFYVPAGTALGTAALTVMTPSASVSVTVGVSEFQPGIFPGAILRAGTADSALTTPVRAGDFLEIYCTGLGPTRTVGGLSVTATTPTGFVGGVPLPPVYSGLAPGFVGLYQVDVRVPAGLAAGSQGVILSGGNAHSNEVKILVQ
jgi:uncharacterized protein (TIGR03437 family)